jgi:rhamnose transport system ATP-binding protein
LRNNMNYRLQVKGICKSFGPIKAVRNVSFDVVPGSVHALVGENGAGKSTLVKIITGMEKPDSGVILLDGVSCNFSTPIDARASGITAVYQDPKLFPHLDIAENIFMGIYPRTSSGMIDKKTMYSRADSMLRELGVAIDSHSPLAGCTVAEIQFVEIVRAMVADLKLLILDEPTASLTPTEAERFFNIVNLLKAKNVSILFISHRLQEIQQICDTITVLRDGEHIITAPAKEISEQDLVHYMVGRDISSLFVRFEAPITEDSVFEVRNLTLPGHFENISFSIHGGEILGMTGLIGAGRTEIAETIFGIRRPSKGVVIINGEEVVPKNPRQMKRHGIAYIPEDRERHGIISSIGVSHNICLAALNRISKFGLLQHKREKSFAAKYVEDFEIKSAGIDAPVASLSGGNRQKVVLAKWLATVPKVLILDEPTHGIDVGTKSQVHERISELASAGFPVLMISSDLPEILGMSDRILVIARGKIVAEFSKREATQEKIMEAAAKHAGVSMIEGANENSD